MSSFQERGQVNLSISKNPEAVYYHPNSNCLAKKHREGNATNIRVPEHIQPYLLQSDLSILLREFGLEL